MAYEIAKIAAKVSLAGGAVYWSIQQGIWGTTKEGSEAGKRLTNAIAPAAKVCVEKIPSLTDVNVSARECWNAGVSSLFKAVSQVPEAEKSPTGALPPGQKPQEEGRDTTKNNLAGRKSKNPALESGSENYKVPKLVQKEKKN